jgi:hypothetical protein
LLIPILICEFDVGQETTGTQETGAVRGRVVLQTGHDAILSKFRRVSAAQNFVTSHGGADHLTCNELVGEAYNEAEARRVVFVFRLHNQSLAGTVVSFAFATTAEFGLVPLVVCLAERFDNESLACEKCRWLKR